MGGVAVSCDVWEWDLGISYFKGVVMLLVLDVIRSNRMPQARDLVNTSTREFILCF